MQPDAERFLERFRAFGSEPDVARYLALFHPDATLFDSGMERPITVPEIPEHIEAILKLAADFRMTPERWRLRDATIFVEAHNQATLRDRRVEWPSVYVIDLRGDQVIRGRRYYDRRPLVSLVFPGVSSQPPFEFALPALPVGLPSGDVGALVRARASSLRAVSGTEMEVLAWAGDDALVFLEWRARRTAQGRAVEVGIAERFDLAAEGGADGRLYFDTLALDSA